MNLNCGYILIDRASVSFVFQAKNLLKNCNSYAAKLGYHATKDIRQVDLLIQYATSKKKYPFYIFYSQPKKTKTKCRMDGSINGTTIYITDAFTVQNLIHDYTRKKLSKNLILAETIPFHCLFLPNNTCWRLQTLNQGLFSNGK